MVANPQTVALPGCGRRRVAPELLARAGPRDREANLRDIERINHWFGGHRLARNLVGEVAGRTESLRILDAGSASGDMGRAIRRAFYRSTVVSLDRRRSHLAAAGEPRVAADAFEPPFPPRSFDIVFCSLLLHEYADGEAELLLRRLFGLARRALIVLDLYRHSFAYRFLPATRRLFGWHPLTLHDGPVSVAAGFRPEELSALARSAGLGDVRVRLHRPWFRLSLLARRKDA